MRGRFARIAPHLALAAASILVVFALSEVALRVARVADPATRWDPYHGFDGTGPFYVRSEGANGEEMWVPAPNRDRLAQSFRVAKAPGTIRVFAIGGSTTEGVPWGPANGFPRAIEEAIRTAGRARVEVINAGISGLGSTRVLEVLEEIVRYDPDVIVAYTGQNEWRDARFYPARVSEPAFVGGFRRFVLSSRTVYVFYRGLVILRERLISSTPRSYAGLRVTEVLARGPDVDHLSAYPLYHVPELVSGDRSALARARGGPKVGLRRAMGLRAWKTIHRLTGRGMASNEEILARFERNVEAMIELARANDAAILFVAKAKNPRARNRISPARVHARDLAVAEDTWRARYQDLVEHLRVARWSEALEAAHAVRAAYRDPGGDVRADKLLDLYEGDCLAALGRWNEAAAMYAARFEPEHCSINRALRSAAARHDVPVLDAQDMLARHSNNGIAGIDRYFVDSVHLMPDGYRLIGCEIGAFLAARDWVPAPGRVTCAAGAAETSLNGDALTTPRALTALAWHAFESGDASLARRRAEAALAALRESDPPEVRLELVQARMLLVYVAAFEGDAAACQREWHALRAHWRELDVG